MNAPHPQGKALLGLDGGIPVRPAGSPPPADMPRTFPRVLERTLNSQ